VYILIYDTYTYVGNLWLSSSFVHDRAYYYLNILMYKFVLLLIFVFSRRADLGLQSALFLIFTVLFFVKNTVIWPYRCFSSGVLCFVCNSLLLVSTSFGLCNGYRIQSAIMVASTETLWYINIYVCMCVCRFTFACFYTRMYIPIYVCRHIMIYISSYRNIPSL
jgi:hypothetical protein